MAKHLKDVYLDGPIGDVLNHFLAAYGASITYELRDKLTSAFLENDRKTIDEILPNVCEPDFAALSVVVARCYNKVLADTTLKELNRRYLGVPLGPGGHRDESGELRRVIQPVDSLAIRNRVNADDSVDRFLRKMLAAYGQASADKASQFMHFATMQNLTKMRELVPGLSTKDFDAVTHYARLIDRLNSHWHALQDTLNAHPFLPYGPDAPVAVPELADEQVARPEDPFAKHFISQMDLLCMSADALVLAEAIVAADQTAATVAAESAVAIRQTTQKLFCGVLNTLPGVCELAKTDARHLKLISESTTMLAKLSQLLLSTKTTEKDATVQD